MQQTETYKLNLIEMDDTFSPDPLNENMEKVEAAMNGLGQQLAALSIRHAAIGTFQPSLNLSVYTGFRPKAVITHSLTDTLSGAMFIDGQSNLVTMTSIGFTITSCSSTSASIKTNYTYVYLALG